MKPIDEQHITQPSLEVLDITGRDKDTVRTVTATLEERSASLGITPVHRKPGKPSVRARIYTDLPHPGRDGPSPQSLGKPSS